MHVCPIAAVKSRIVLGEPLPFNVRDASNRLLLSRGQVIVDQTQLQELFDRGALVEVEDLTETVPAARPVTPARRQALSVAWERSGNDVRQALSAGPAQLTLAVDNSTDMLLTLIERSPNMALAQVVRQSDSSPGHYGVDHSIHAATACLVAARHLGWAAADQRRAFQAALTMNLGMLELQAQLATQIPPPTAKQRETIRQHPTRSADMLADAGVRDELWLSAVACHHELPDGKGYPQGVTEISELAEMLRWADVYTARLASRAHRPAVSAQRAGRELHLVAGSSPLAAALIKAFGIFPPGSWVRLASGELGLVVSNGVKAYHPMVAALTSPSGAPYLKPLLRNSSGEGHAIVALLSERAMPMRVSVEQIDALIGGA